MNSVVYSVCNCPVSTNGVFTHAPDCPLGQTDSHTDVPTCEEAKGPTGWICPHCGAGVSPYIAKCCAFQTYTFSYGDVT